MATRKTMVEWFAYLDSTERQLTLEEFTAQMLFHLRQRLGQVEQHGLNTSQAAEHLEGMFGSLDELMATRDEVYQEIAAKRARPVSALPNGGR